MLGPTSWSENGQLKIEDCLVKDVIAAHGTPLYAYSEHELISNIRTFKQAFSKRWSHGEVRILPAIKANSRLAICRLLARETNACDLFSEGELHAAMTAGFDPRLMSLNGNGKLTADLDFLRYAIGHDVRLTLDDAAEFDPVERIARELGKKARIRLRMRLYMPELKEPSELAGGDVPTSLALFIYRPGIPDEHLVPLGRRILASDSVELTGLHIHMARHHATLPYWHAVMSALARQLGRLKLAWNGWEPREIDIGGGFAQSRDPCGRALSPPRLRQLALARVLRRLPDAFDELRQRLQARSLESVRRQALESPDAILDRVDGPTIDEYAETITATLSRQLNIHRICPQSLTLELEPGRALYGSAGIHVTRINHIKHQTDPFTWSWVVTDTSESFFSGAHVEHPVFPYTVIDKAIERYPTADRLVADINGMSCNSDRIVGNACLPGDIAIGDYLVFHDVGAYEEQSADNFNSLPRPASVLVHGDRVDLIRSRETVDDVFAHDVIPERLRLQAANKAAAGTSG